MLLKNHRQSSIKKVLPFSIFRTISGTSAIFMMLLFFTNSEKTASSEKVSTEEFVAGISFRNNLFAETGVPAGVNFQDQIKFYNKYRFEDSGLCTRGKEKVMDRRDFSGNNFINPSCSG